MLVVEVSWLFQDLVLGLDNAVETPCMRARQIGIVSMPIGSWLMVIVMR